MRIVDSETGESSFRKRRRRYGEVGQARELTFSCYRGFRFLGRDRTRQWFVEALQAARHKWVVDLWAYVLMPEHVHLLVLPRREGEDVSHFLRDVKEPVARRALQFLGERAPEWPPRLRVREGARVRHRFWQPGGGYDRSIEESKTLQFVTDYIHLNPVRRGLVDRAEDRAWSSAQWYAGMKPVVLEMDRTMSPD